MSPLLQACAIRQRCETILGVLYAWHRKNRNMGDATRDEFELAVLLQWVTISRAAQLLALTSAANDDCGDSPRSA